MKSIKYDGKEYKWREGNCARDIISYNTTIPFEHLGKKRTIHISVENPAGLFGDYSTFRCRIGYDRNGRDFIFGIYHDSDIERRKCDLSEVKNMNDACEKTVEEAFEFIKEIQQRSNEDIDFSNIHLDISDYSRFCHHISFEDYQIMVFVEDLMMDEVVRNGKKRKLTIQSPYKHYKIYDSNLNELVYKRDVHTEVLKEYIKEDLKEIISKEIENEL